MLYVLLALFLSLLNIAWQNDGDDDDDDDDDDDCTEDWRTVVSILIYLIISYTLLVECLPCAFPGRRMIKMMR